MADNAKFFLDLGRFEGRIPIDANVFKQKIALDILGGVVLKTPVKSGRAKGNWQVTLGDIPSSGETGLFDKTGASALAAGEAQIFQVEAGEDLWIHNNVPYIQRLEEGHSKKQAPHGMLALTLAEIESQFA